MLSRHASRVARSVPKVLRAIVPASTSLLSHSVALKPQRVASTTASARALARAPAVSLPHLLRPVGVMAAPARTFSSSEEATEPFEATEPRESVDFDVVIVGAGPAGLSAAIRLKQLAAAAGTEMSVCVVEKAAQVGDHILSGNVFIPTYLNELIPDWKEKGAPLHTPVVEDRFFALTETASVPLPIPPSLHNEGNYIISLGRLCEWLSSQAEELGVDVYTGFAAAEVLYNEETGAVEGIATGDVGIGKDGQPTGNYARGMEIRAKQTLFAEGARGSCSEEVISKFNLRDGKEGQTYGIGIKEVWEVPAAQHTPGKVVHTIGYPSPVDTYSGSFMYHVSDPDSAEGDMGKVLLGLVIGLDYPNPHLNPYMELQTLKHHPLFAKTLEGGRCISYGARVINEGGYQSIPKVTFPGGALLGCSAGYVNVPKIKGSHNAMKSGMDAAEAIFARVATKAGIADAAAIATGTASADAIAAALEGKELDLDGALAGQEVEEYLSRMEASPVTAELKEVRNVRPAFKFGLLPFLANAAFEQFILHRSAPWTISHGHGRDCDATKPAAECKPIEYRKPDGVLSFPLLENLARSGVNHEENQPAHLKVKPGKEGMPAESLAKYAAPESRFCPAGVYEYPEQADGSRKLQINAQNCVHCKTCSIKTPDEFIKWTVPEGGGGPAYSGM